MNSFVLDSLRGLNEIIQFNLGSKRLDEINEKIDALGEKQKELKKFEGRAKAITDSTIMAFLFGILLVALALEARGLIGFDGVLISTISLMSSFGPVVALSSLSNNMRHTLL